MKCFLPPYTTRCSGIPRSLPLWHSSHSRKSGPRYSSGDRSWVTPCHVVLSHYWGVSLCSQGHKRIGLSPFPSIPLQREPQWCQRLSCGYQQIGRGAFHWPSLACLLSEWKGCFTLYLYRRDCHNTLIFTFRESLHEHSESESSAEHECSSSGLFSDPMWTAPGKVVVVFRDLQDAKEVLVASAADDLWVLTSKTEDEGGGDLLYCGSFLKLTGTLRFLLGILAFVVDVALTFWHRGMMTMVGTMVRVWVGGQVMSHL